MEQWYDNGYGDRDQYELLDKILPNMKTETASKVKQLIQKSHSKSSGKLDDVYYKICDQFMEDCQIYLKSFKNKK